MANAFHTSKQSEKAIDHVSKRLIQLLELIRPPLPNGADYTKDQKVEFYDRARRTLYDDTGMIRPFDPRLSKWQAAIVIASLVSLSWALIAAITVEIVHDL